MHTETMTKYGFVKDENGFQLKEVLKDNAHFQEVHIDIYPENPLVKSATAFMLLLRTSEKNAVISNDDVRLVMKRDDTYKTHFMNVLFSKISECFCKASDGYFEFILNIQNIYYKLTVLN